MRFLILRSFTSQISSATWEIRPVWVGRGEGQVSTTRERSILASANRALTEVVRHNHDASLVVFNRQRQSVDRGHVQMVRRLIEQQDVRVLHRELCEDNAIPEPVRELLDR